MGLLNNFLSFMPTLTAVAGDLKPPGGMWEWLLINGFGWIKDYGLRIIVFIILLKVVLLPLDIFQRYKMRKNQKINERIKPQLEELQKRYGNDKATLSQKQMELNKKEGFSYFSSCIPMILTLVIFFTLLTGMNNISQYMIFRQYAEWYDTYTNALTLEEEKLGDEYLTLNQKIESDTQKTADLGESISSKRAALLESDASLADSLPDLDAVRATDSEGLSDLLKPIDSLIESGNFPDIESGLAEYKTVVTEYVTIWDELADLNTEMVKMKEPAIKAAQQAVIDFHAENPNSFLWIKSIWQPDTTWSSPVFENENAFRAAVSSYIGGSSGCGSCNAGKNRTGLSQDTLDKMMGSYDEVTSGIIESQKGEKNGYFILVALVVLLSFFSQWITQRIQKRSGQFEANGATGGGTMKIMMFMMPILLGIFAIRYTAAFALYMVTNSAITILINTIVTLIMNMKDKRSRVKVETTINKYGRPDPRDLNK